MIPESNYDPSYTQWSIAEKSTVLLRFSMVAARAWPIDHMDMKIPTCMSHPYAANQFMYGKFHTVTDYTRTGKSTFAFMRTYGTSAPQETAHLWHWYSNSWAESAQLSLPGHRCRELSFFKGLLDAKLARYDRGLGTLGQLETEISNWQLYRPFHMYLYVQSYRTPSRLPRIVFYGLVSTILISQPGIVIATI